MAGFRDVRREIAESDEDFEHLSKYMNHDGSAKREYRATYLRSKMDWWDFIARSIYYCWFLVIVIHKFVHTWDGFYVCIFERRIISPRPQINALHYCQLHMILIKCIHEQSNQVWPYLYAYLLINCSCWGWTPEPPPRLWSSLFGTGWILITRPASSLPFGCGQRYR